MFTGFRAIESDVKMRIMYVKMCIAAFDKDWTESGWNLVRVHFSKLMLDGSGMTETEIVIVIHYRVISETILKKYCFIALKNFTSKQTLLFELSGKVRYLVGEIQIDFKSNSYSGTAGWRISGMALIASFY